MVQSCAAVDVSYKLSRPFAILILTVKQVHERSNRCGALLLSGRGAGGQTQERKALQEQVECSHCRRDPDHQAVTVLSDSTRELGAGVAGLVPKGSLHDA
jgi:hypothetical protein